jgi:carbonic anhydrase
MDFRLRKYLNDWTDRTITKGYDLVTIAGGVKNCSFIIEQVAISVQLHGTSEVYLINHEDCGAYGKTGTYKKHQKDLLFAKKIINDRFLTLKIFPYYLKLDGEFVEVK